MRRRHESTLALTLAAPAASWARHDGTIDVLPLLEEFAEGNGGSRGRSGDDRSRGSGAGVTWGCHTDVDIGNRDATDCVVHWADGGAEGAEPTAAPFLHENGMRGEAVWNVTDDVLAGVNAWLLKKTEERQGGSARYHSREGAAAADDPGLAPRLILDR